MSCRFRAEIDTSPGVITMSADGIHVVWDWNGTLLDDFSVRLECVNYTLASFDFAPMTADDYRRCITRPIRDFYESALGALATERYRSLARVYSQCWRSRIVEAELTSDALAAIEAVNTHGTQSLLSMAYHDELVEDMARVGLDPAHFTLVAGSRTDDGVLKADSLSVHLESLQLDPTRVVLIGDSLDDAAAARSVGCSVVLFEGGTHHRRDLESVGVPVANTLVGSVSFAISTLERRIPESGLAKAQLHNPRHRSVTAAVAESQKEA